MGPLGNADSGQVGVHLEVFLEEVVQHLLSLPELLKLFMFSVVKGIVFAWKRPRFEGRSDLPDDESLPFRYLRESLCFLLFFPRRLCSSDED